MKKASAMTKKSVIDEASHHDDDGKSVGDDAFFIAKQPEKRRA